MITVAEAKQRDLITYDVILPFLNGIDQKYAALAPHNRKERTELINKIIADLMAEISATPKETPISFSPLSFVVRISRDVDELWPLQPEPPVLTRFFYAIKQTFQ